MNFEGRSIAVAIRKAVRLVWRKRRCICLGPDCQAKSFAEETLMTRGLERLGYPQRDKLLFLYWTTR